MQHVPDTSTTPLLLTEQVLCHLVETLAQLDHIMDNQASA